jgi:uncharacterized membrane protein YfcA
MDLFGMIVLAALVCIVAALYSSVGHGGASGYLAVLSLFSIGPAEMSTTALILNVIVSAIGFISFLRAKHFTFSLAWPFLLLSVPAAFVGGMIHTSDRTYLVLLALVLLVAAYRMYKKTNGGNEVVEAKAPPLSVALPVGGGIGFLSGIVGVGGGIFLSPLMIAARWADPKHTAAVSAFFILINSLAGIGGRLVSSNFFHGSMVYLIVAAVIGGLGGSYLGANKFTALVLRRILSVVLIIAAAKLIITIAT